MAQDGGGWLAGIGRGTIGSVTRTAAISPSVAVVVLALVVGPALPGAGEKAILDTTPVGSGTRQTVSPLVDIQGRIVDRSDLEAFTVLADAEELLATDGARRVRRPPVDLGAGLRRGRRRARTAASPQQLTVPLNQEFTIEALDAIWLPAAYAPERIDIADSVRQYDTEDREPGDPPQRGAARHDLWRRLPGSRARAEHPRAGHRAAPRRHRRQPTRSSDFPDTFRQLAADITASGSTPYQKSKLLQDWFQRNFTYDLAVPRGHSTNAIANFLEIRRGYCEQFAGTYAAFARCSASRHGVAVGLHAGRAAQRRDATTSSAGTPTLVAEVYPHRHRVGPLRADPERGTPRRRDLHRRARAQEVARRPRRRPRRLHRRPPCPLTTTVDDTSGACRPSTPASRVARRVRPGSSTNLATAHLPRRAACRGAG